MRPKPARNAAARKTSAAAFIFEDERWRAEPATLRLMRRAARLALEHRPKKARGVTVVLSGDARLRDLNRRFRKKDKATNVLSFPSRDPLYWGDVAIAFGVVTREAKAQHKTVPAHAAHLTVHGILHLKGYDHGSASERALMERAEILILSRLGLPDPYTIRDPQKR